MSIQPRPARGRKQDQQLTQRVIEAAYADLAEAGFARLSLEGVARRAGVSRTAIYKRWPSLADLLLDVAVHTLETLGYTSDHLELQHPGTGTLAGDFTAFFAEGLERLTLLDGVGVARPLLAESMLDLALGDRVRGVLFKGDEASFGAIIKDAVDRGEIEDPGANAEHIFQTLIGYGIFRAYLMHTSLDEAGLRNMAEVVARGLRG